jgi:valyl-tRNA synthetase
LDRETREILGNFDDLKDGLGEIIGEEKVFDTWMDSSNSNLFVSGYLTDMDTFEKAFPTAMRPQGKEIVRTWLYYTLLKSALLLDKPGFKHVWIDGLGMDPWGRKMSKSLGNGIDANSVLECGESKALTRVYNSKLTKSAVNVSVCGKHVMLRLETTSTLIQKKLNPNISVF